MQLIDVLRRIFSATPRFSNRCTNCGLTFEMAGRDPQDHHPGCAGPDYSVPGLGLPSGGLRFSIPGPGRRCEGWGAGADPIGFKDFTEYNHLSGCERA